MYEEAFLLSESCPDIKQCPTLLASVSVHWAASGSQFKHPTTREHYFSECVERRLKNKAYSRYKFSEMDDAYCHAFHDNQNYASVEQMYCLEQSTELFT